VELGAQRRGLGVIGGRRPEPERRMDKRVRRKEGARAHQGIDGRRGSPILSVSEAVGDAG
jgi:hypothetical protein